MRKTVNKKDSTKKNLFYNMIYQITALIIPFITAPYLSRTIGAEGIGVYSYYNSISLYFIYFALLGILNYGNRLIAKKSNNIYEKNKNFSSLYYFQLIVSITITMIFAIYAVFISKNTKSSIIFIIYVASSIFDVSWLFFGLQEFKITSIRQIIIRVINFLTIFMFVKNKNDINIYIFIICLGNFISSFSLWCIAWKKVRLIKCSMKDIIKHVKPCLILFIPIIATSVYRLMDKIMIGKFQNMSEVGIYENSEKLITISIGLVSAFSAVIMPKISNCLGNKKYKEAERLFYNSMEIAIFIGVALCFGIASISKEFIPIYFGIEFYESIKLTIGLAITIPIMTISCIIRTLYLIPYEKDNIYIISVIIGAIFNFIINILLLPLIGTIGAVIGTIIAELSVITIQIVLLRNNIKINKIINYLMIFIIIGISMSIFIRLISLLKINDNIKLVLEIFLGGIIYLIFSIRYFYIKQNEYLINFIKKIDKKRNNYDI